MKRLNELLITEVVSLNRRVDCWEEAIRLAGELLVENGDVEPQYVEDAVKTAVDVGPYFVVRPSVAISHARPGRDVNNIGLSMVSLSPAVNFGHADNDPVSIIFMLATLDNESHIDVLRELATLLSSDELVDQLIQAQTYDQVSDILKITD